MALLQISEPGQSPDPHQRRIAVGIDLGTTHCALSYVDMTASDGEATQHGVLPIPQLTAPGAVESLALLPFCQAFVEQFSASENLAPGVLAVSSDAPLSLCFDRAHLDQILWNLVSNALRHSSGSPGAVRLQISPGSAEGRVELHVIDDGPGISPAVREQVFEPFFTTHHAGTGLGLFIARELAAANGATLELLATSSGGHFVIAGRNNSCQLPEVSDARPAS